LPMAWWSYPGYWAGCPKRIASEKKRREEKRLAPMNQVRG